MSRNKKKYADWAREYPDHLILVRAGAFYSAWGRSAEVLNEVLDYKLVYTSKANIPYTGGSSLEILEDALTSNQINYIVVHNNNIIEKKEFEHCDGVFYRPDDFQASSKVKGEDYSIEDKLQAIEALLDGVDPFTGEILDEDHLVNNDLIQSIIIKAQTSLLRQRDREERWGASSPEKWTKAEEIKLEEEYKNGLSIKEIAEKHNRTEGAIRNRLAKIVFKD